MVDLDSFKELNDTRGHARGDEVLQSVGERMRACVRDADAVARFGGDEFAVLLCEPSTVDDAQAVADAMRRRLSIAVSDEIGELTVSASLGAGQFGDGVTPMQALADADNAMYADKRSRRKARV